MRRYAVVVVVTAVAVLLAVVGTSSAAILLDRVVAVVNDEAITWGELYKAMEFELSREMKALSPEQKKAVFDENESLFLEEMINKKLQIQEAQKYGISVSANEVNSAIAGIMKKYSMNEEQFMAAINAEGFSIDEYHNMLREQLTIGKIIDVAVRSNVYLPDEALKDIPPGDAFYKIRQVFISDGPDAEERAGQAMAELEAGANFTAVVRKYSDDSLGSTSGDLGLIQKSTMSKEFADAVEGLSPGQVSQPFRSAKGIHIIRVEQIRDVKDVLTEERFMESFSDWLRSLREKAFIEIRL